MNPARIVIVEDDLLIAQSIRHKLEQAGYEVPSILTSGQEAIRSMFALAPDLVLMDIELDGQIDGIQVGQEIGHQIDVPIIYLTAYATDEIFHRAKLTAPYGYILKPFRDRELLNNIEIALYRHHLERELRMREAELSAVFNSVQAMLLIVDHNQRIIKANQAAISFVGTSNDRVIGEKPGNILGCLNSLDRSDGCGAGPACVRCPVRQTILDTLKTGQPHRQVEATLPIQIDEQIEMRTWLISTTPMGTGQDRSVLVSFDDITTRKQAEARMQVMSEMLDVAPNSIVVHDQTGKFLYANQKTFELHRYLPDEFMALNLRDLDTPASAALIESRMQQIIETGEAAFEVEHICRDGSIIPLEIFVKQVDWLGQPAMLSIGTDISARKRAEQEREKLMAQIRAQAQQLGDVLYALPEGVLLLNSDHRVLIANAAAQRDLALLADIHDDNQILTALGNIPLDQLLTWPQDPAWHEVKSQDRTFEVIGRPVHLEPEQIGWVMVLRDMTQERAIQAHIRQQDRLAVIGQLAGGIAHDFNNLLTAIKGYTEFVIDELPPDHPVLSDLYEMRRAADRATALTAQLLLFSRKKAVQPCRLQLNDTINEALKMLRRLIGESIRFVVRLEANLPPIMADPGQMEQILMNLCLNARDALPNGGQILIETNYLQMDSTSSRPSDLPAGKYVMLAVADNGIGMSPEIQAHLFEPFFTTKKQGTGLGLSVVWGIVQQCNGYIYVESQVGQGSTFRIYLPVAEELAASPTGQCEERKDLTGTETLLLVEDEDSVRTLSERTLSRLGYTVLTAHLPEEAIRLSEQYADQIALLITDVVMPEMNGRTLAEKLRTHLPNLPVLYVSGYTEDGILPHDLSFSEASILYKPYDQQALARKVREILDARPTNTNR